MSILHLTRDFPPHATGGLSNAVGGLVQACGAAGLECTVISFDSWRPRSSQRAAGAARKERGDNGLLVWRVRAPDQFEALLVEISQVQPAIVHVHDGMLAEQLQMILSTVAEPAVCVTTHVLHRELNRLRGVTRPTLSLLGQDAVLAMADAVIAPSRAAYDLLARDQPELIPHLHCIGLGSSSPEVVTGKSTNPVALYTGRFSDVKGTAELIEAIPRLLSTCKGLWMMIAGGNPESPKSERRWLRRLTGALSPADLHRVIFTGWISSRALSSVLQRSTVQLVPSWFETFGLSALEAMAHGVPVVGTTAGALPELIEHGRTGLLGPPRDVETLVSNALRLLTDPGLAHEMGKAAAERVRRHFGWSEVVSRHRSLYQQLVQQDTPPTA